MFYNWKILRFTQQSCMHIIWILYLYQYRINRDEYDKSNWIIGFLNMQWYNWYKSEYVFRVNEGYKSEYVLRVNKGYKSMNDTTDTSDSRVWMIQLIQVIQEYELCNLSLLFLRLWNYVIMQPHNYVIYQYDFFQ